MFLTHDAREAGHTANFISLQKHTAASANMSSDQIHRTSAVELDLTQPA